MRTPCRARLSLKPHNSVRHCSRRIISKPTMPCVCDPETCRIMNASQRDYIPFPTGESYEDDVIPMRLFSLATLWLKLDTHTRFCSWGNMSTIATSACHAYMHRSCIFRWFLIRGLPLPEYWSVAWRRKKEMQRLVSYHEHLYLCIQQTILSKATYIAFKVDT